MKIRVLFLSLFVLLGAASIPHIMYADETADRRAALEQQLAALEKEIAANQAEADKLSSQGQSLSRDVQLLQADINKAKLQVQATQVAIRQLDGNITVHEKTLGALSTKLTAERESLAQIIRNTDQIDDYSLVELAFSAQDVSTFFGDLDSYTTLKEALGESFTDIRGTRSATETEKEKLIEQLSSQEELRNVQVLAQQKVADQQKQKQTLLTQTKGQESAYKQIIQAQQKSAGQIRAELFSLAGGGGPIPLPTAIALAKTAGSSTGVRPAFILGVLKQETNIGANIGNGNWAIDMHPARDVPVFKVMMQTLGLNPDSVQVSKAPSYGYGGAMGPAQFIPSTWACYGGYVNTTTGSCGKGTDGTYAGPWAYQSSSDRVARAAGHPGSPSSPYNNLDAFTATAIYMADLGAAAQTPAAERTAALKYFAGGNYTNPAYAFYGDGVMGFATQFQSDIDTLSGS